MRAKQTEISDSTQLVMIFRWEGINNCIEQAKDLPRDDKVKFALFCFLALFAISIRRLEQIDDRCTDCFEKCGIISGLQ